MDIDKFSIRNSNATADRAHLRKITRGSGLQEVRFRFDFEGTKILTMDKGGIFLQNRSEAEKDGTR